MGRSGFTTISGSGGYSDGRGNGANFNFNGQPSQLTLEPSGSLLLADYNNATVRRFVPSTQTASTVVGLFGAYGIQPGPLPTPITYPRAAVPIPGGIAFVANYGIFVVR